MRRRFRRVLLDVPNLSLAMHESSCDVFFLPSVYPSCGTLLPLFFFNTSVLITCPFKQSLSFAYTVSADTVRIWHLPLLVERIFGWLLDWPVPSKRSLGLIYRFV